MIQMDPIFIIGAPRSGTTVLHRALCAHPQVSWLSGLAVRYPARPGLNRRLMQALDLPLVGRWAGRRFRPWEGYDFWEYHCRGFRRPYRDLLAQDASARTQRYLPPVFRQLASPRRPQLLIKITGWPRIGFLRQVFPQARFVHIIRDGRAVANSLIKTDFWQGWGGPDHWRWGPLTEAQAARWAQTGQAFIALAGLQWEILLQAAAQASAGLDAATYLEVRYEALCADPAGVIQQIATFCGLPWQASFAAQVAARPWHNRNDKWQQDLTPAQQAALQAILHDSLGRYGYESA